MDPNNFPELRCSAISSPITPSIERIEHSSTIPNFNYNTIEHTSDFSESAPIQPLIERTQLSLGKWDNRDNHIGSSRSSSDTPLSSRVLNAQGLLFCFLMKNSTTTTLATTLQTPFFFLLTLNCQTTLYLESVVNREFCHKFIKIKTSQLTVHTRLELAVNFQLTPI